MGTDFSHSRQPRPPARGLPPAQVPGSSTSGPGSARPQPAVTGTDGHTDGGLWERQGLQSKEEKGKAVALVYPLARPVRASHPGPSPSPGCRPKAKPGTTAGEIHRRLPRALLPSGEGGRGLPCPRLCPPRRPTRTCCEPPRNPRSSPPAPQNRQPLGLGDRRGVRQPRAPGEGSRGRQLSLGTGWPTPVPQRQSPHLGLRLLPPRSVPLSKVLLLSPGGPGGLTAAPLRPRC